MPVVCDDLTILNASGKTKYKDRKRATRGFFLKCLHLHFLLDIHKTVSAIF